MAKFYGTLQGNRGLATRCGTTDISVSAQSWNGSVITNLRYDDKDKLEVRLSVSDDSNSGGWGSEEIFRGSLEELKSICIKYKKHKAKLAERRERKC